MNQPTMPTYVRPAAVTAVSTALFGLSIAIAVAFVPWLAERNGTLWEPVRSGARGWLIAHGSGATIESAAFDLVPLGATMALVGLTAWVVVKTVVDPVESFFAFAGLTAVMYATIVVVVCGVVQTDSVGSSILRAAATSLVVVAIGVAIGLSLGHGEPARWWQTQEPRIRSIAFGACTGAATLLLIAALVFVVLLIVNIQRFTTLWSALDPGFFGGLALAALCLAMVPNAVLWTASALLGPGFALGTDTSVDLTGAHLGAVPGLPLLAALPDPGQFPGWVFLLALVPLASGGVAGWGWRRSYNGSAELVEVCLNGAISGAIAGVVVGALVAVSGGSIGPGRMADVGPPIITPLLTATLVLALGGTIGAIAGHYRGVRAAASK